MENDIVKQLERIMKDLSPYERKGLDTSSLKIFTKNFKEFLKLNNDSLSLFDLSFENKLDLIKAFLEDKNAFPTIQDVIQFANNKLTLDFKDQKASRKITISRIIGRINSKPELKDTLKSAVLSIRNEKVHKVRNSKSKKDIIDAQTFNKWAEIIKNI